jgi:hypothetical protein
MRERARECPYLAPLDLADFWGVTRRHSSVLLVNVKVKRAMKRLLAVSLFVCNMFPGKKPG